MGNDGGSIPLRRELVKQKTKEEKVDVRAQLIARWSYCALSKQPLQEPVVGDAIGKLYNREAMLEFLLDRAGAYGDADAICSHIKSIKDVKTLNLTKKDSLAGGKARNDSSAHDLTAESKFICPITLKEMNGHYPFVFLWSCGCVFSEKSLKELNATECPLCGKPFEKSETVPINPSPDKQRELLEAWRSQKKAGKRKKSKSDKDQDGKQRDGDGNNKRVKAAKSEAAKININGTSVEHILKNYGRGASSRTAPTSAVNNLFINSNAAP
ncbi:Replication termination factor 2 [Spiromyces aspiralis]|uniref:Replication termination factor 2 n=1 Tax=Spiromyces aspiralis TaxID=68401 RepID=A0ACC1HSV9_9FUNG|nr:Replication termination factor 2 [Spiromyces aspiralis]